MQEHSAAFAINPLEKLHKDQVHRFIELTEGMSAKQVHHLLSALEQLAGRKPNLKTTEPSPTQGISPLHKMITAREKEILILLANGYTRRNISECLGITKHTAASHIYHIYQKLSISSVAEATQIAISAGLTKCDNTANYLVNAHS